MDPQISQELNRIVGGEAVKVTEVDTAVEANRRVKLETEEATYELPANRLLVFLQNLPDRIGVPALRKAIEERFPSTTEVD